MTDKENPMRIVKKSEFLAVLRHHVAARMVKRDARTTDFVLDGKRIASIATLPTGAKQFRLDD